MDAVRNVDGSPSTPSEVHTVENGRERTRPASGADSGRGPFHGADVASRIHPTGADLVESVKAMSFKNRSRRTAGAGAAAVNLDVRAHVSNDCCKCHQQQVK